MLEAHVPVTLLTPEQVNTAACNVLFLTNARWLNEPTVEAIERFVRRGGGLVMTYQTRYETSRKPDP